MPESCRPRKPRCRCQSLLMLSEREKRASFVINRPPSFHNPHIVSSSSLPPLLLWMLCRRTEWGRGRGTKCCCGEQQLLLAGSKGQQASSSCPTRLWRCLTDSQQLAPPAMQGSGCWTPRVTSPHWTGEGPERDVLLVSFVACLAVVVYSVASDTITVYY